MRVLVTGSAGLVGFEASNYYLKKGCEVVGIDNDMRAQFYGPDASVQQNIANLKGQVRYVHYDIDLRNTSEVEHIFTQYDFDLIVHAAAQPSHNHAERIPIIDFDINARATLALLDIVHRLQPSAVFAYLSTNKVYGVHPNQLTLEELPTRFDFSDATIRDVGISEKMALDHTTHSLMGASKLAADIYVQEYGRYHGLKTVCFRCGCITGGQQAGVTQHGFLNYIVKQAVHAAPYTIFGFKGKQVRDHIHAFDVVTAIDAFFNNPSAGAVYNLGGGATNALSILETIEVLSTKGLNLTYTVSADPRKGDHICYYTDFRKFQNDFPKWTLSRDVSSIIDEIINVHAS